MSTFKRVAIFGASGNFGTPITAALVNGGFDVTVVTRRESASVFPPGLAVIRTDYTSQELVKALAGQDATVCVVGPAGVPLQATMAEAAEAAGVKRFIIDDFGWGMFPRTFPEFAEIGIQRRVGWDRVEQLSKANSEFTWTGISVGNPTDWALKKFPLMGFDIAQKSAIIYDDGTEHFTGTTLQGIGQAVLGVLTHPNETKNRFVKAMSIKICQNDLLDAFQKATKTRWTVKRSTTKELAESGRKKQQDGDRGWILELVVAQLLDFGEARCLVASSREDSDSELLGIIAETPDTLVEGVLRGM